MADSDSDLYGFTLKLSVQQVAERQDCDEISEKTQSAWRPYVESNKMPPESKLKDLARKGVPPTLRTWVWTESSGATLKKAQFAGTYYQNMVLAGQSSPCMKNIEQDIPHTFPNHPWLQCKDGQDALRRVLSAYSVHNSSVGYCRSMNNVVAMLLVSMNRNEENTFWLLAALVEDILYQGTYADNLEGCQIEMKALDELVFQKLPRLHAHFKELECDISIIATEWYLCLFSSSMPSETVARIWDALFNEGPKILFRVALALLKLYEETLLRHDNAGEVLMTMKQAAQNLHHRDRLMAVAFDGIGSLPMAVIDKYREMRQKEVQEAVREREALKNRQKLKEVVSGTASQEITQDFSRVSVQESDKPAEGTFSLSKVRDGFVGAFSQLKDKLAQ